MSTGVLHTTLLSAFIFLLEKHPLIHPRTAFAFSTAASHCHSWSCCEQYTQFFPFYYLISINLYIQNFFCSQAMTCVLWHLIQFHCFVPQEYPAGDDENKLGQQGRSTNEKDLYAWKAKEIPGSKATVNERKLKVEPANRYKRSWWARKGRMSLITSEKKLS